VGGFLDTGSRWTWDEALAWARKGPSSRAGRPVVGCVLFFFLDDPYWLCWLEGPSKGRNDAVFGCRSPAGELEPF